MNLPNKLTISRILLTFIFVFLLKINGFYYKLAAFLIFSLACFTDCLDGYIARKNKNVTNLGRILDPIADKILVISAFITFSQLNLVESWMVAVILTREFIVTGLRIFALAKGKIIEAQPIGKHKTISSYLAIFLILAFLILRESGLKTIFQEVYFYQASSFLIYVLMLIVITFTVISGINYIFKNAFLLKDPKIEKNNKINS